MNKLLIALLLFCCNLAYAQTWVKLIQVEDGDTLLVSMDDTTQRIQLAGIDTPEDSQNPKLAVDIKRTGLKAEQLLPLGQAASQHLKNLVKPEEQLSLSGDLHQKDRYGRTVAQVSTKKGESLSLIMVADGYARPIKSATLPSPFADKLKSAFQNASDHHQGLWQSHPKNFKAWLAAQK